MADTDVKAILDERGQKYGENAWLTTGEIETFLAERGLLLKVQASGLFHAWDMVLNKLVRALNDPTYPDNWRDMAGYATLVLNSLNNKPQAPQTQAHQDYVHTPDKPIEMSQGVRDLTKDKDGKTLPPGVRVLAPTGEKK